MGSVFSLQYIILNYHPSVSTIVLKFIPFLVGLTYFRPNFNVLLCLAKTPLEEEIHYYSSIDLVLNASPPLYKPAYFDRLEYVYQRPSRIIIKTGSLISLGRLQNENLKISYRDKICKNPDE